MEADGAAGVLAASLSAGGALPGTVGGPSGAGVEGEVKSSLR